MDPALRAWLERFRSRTRAAGALLVLLLLGGLGFLPQFAGPGYEAALLAGVVLPGLTAVVAALEGARERYRPVAAVLGGMGLGAAFATLGFVTVLLHGARAGFCDPGEGLALYLLAPGAGGVLGGAWGAIIGLVVAARPAARARWKRTALVVGVALAGPLAGIAVSLGRFYTSPMVFAFDPFFGAFAGPLYDTVVNLIDRLITYRWGTGATLVALLAAAQVLEADAANLRRKAAARPGMSALALVAALGSLAHSASGPRYGHWSTAASIESALGAHLAGRRCDVVYARGLAERDVRLFTRDCDAALPAIEAYFGARGPERVRVFLFANDAEKGFLMGASRTYIAKPWRREVYVQAAPFPHPVIVHELAHVVAGSFARGPFRVAGPLGGLWPDPGRIEGFAVAAAPDETDELTEREWAASMQKLGILPSLSSIFELDFLGLTASKAYTVAGAFVDFLREGYGPEALRRWYAGEELPALTKGKDLAALERDFRASLARLTIPERALLTAKARFEQPPFFERRCPRIVDRALGEAAERLGAGDAPSAEERYRAALRLDPGNTDARFGLAACARVRKEFDLALQRYVELSVSKDIPKLHAAKALELGADLAFQQDRGAQAQELYGRALELVFDTDRRRTLEVKRLASVGPGHRAIGALLIGDAETGPSYDVAAPLLQAWSDADPSHDLPRYLIGRNLFLIGRSADAAKYLDESLALPPKLASVRREALRLRLLASCALGDVPRTGEILAIAVADPELPLARREGLQRLAERCGVRGATTAANLAPPSALSPASPTPPTQRAEPRCPGGMRLLPGGRFWVGSEPSEGFSDDESPRYLTELAPFCLDETEVTAEAYASCVASGACQATKADHVLCNFGRPGRNQHPMNCLEWTRADAFCKAKGARLPREAEIEYALRGGDRYQKYPWGDAEPDGHTCWKQPKTCPVKSFPADAFGLFDVSGNVWEWSDDWYGPYPWPPESGFAKVYRGGSFSRRFEKWMHARLRDRGAPSKGGAHLGFRCALTPEGARCPFGVEAPGRCRHGVIERACADEKTWNGVRCARADEPKCGAERVEKPGFGCVLEHEQEPVAQNPETETLEVKRERTIEHDADCQKNSRDRPQAFRYVGGSHAARNLVSRRAGCKNRDVGVGWNSTCCP
ncbi:MAG TPA: SUMF1/EgtB/PvdO family nonheme iron enzyme [Polyangiaceae bacterium]